MQHSAKFCSRLGRAAHGHGGLPEFCDQQPANSAIQCTPERLSSTEEIPYTQPPLADVRTEVACSPYASRATACESFRDNTARIRPLFCSTSPQISRFQIYDHPSSAVKWSMIGSGAYCCLHQALANPGAWNRQASKTPGRSHQARYSTMKSHKLVLLVVSGPFSERIVPCELDPCAQHSGACTVTSMLAATEHG